MTGAPDTATVTPELDRMVQGFEDAIAAQKPVAAEHYDGEYFTSDWREGDNRYDLETRRRVEGRNPELITEVFSPTRVLDVGVDPAS